MALITVWFLKVFMEQTPLHSIPFLSAAGPPVSAPEASAKAAFETIKRQLTPDQIVSYVLTHMQNATMVEKMAFVAREAHAHQRRKLSGLPYFDDHIVPVVEELKAKYAEHPQLDTLLTVAYGHDLIGDTKITSEHLCLMGFPQTDIFNRIVLLGPSGNFYLDQIEEIGKDPIAARVKRKDIKINYQDGGVNEDKNDHLYPLAFHYLGRCLEDPSYAGTSIIHHAYRLKYGSIRQKFANSAIDGHDFSTLSAGVLAKYTKRGEFTFFEGQSHLAVHPLSYRVDE
jgi:hypothetical protein